MSDKRLLAFYQQALGGVSASEELLLRDEFLRRLIAAGITIDVNGVIAGVPPPTIIGGLTLASLLAGDLLYATGASALTRLAAGAAGTVLKGGATPSWATIVNADVDVAAAIAASKLAAAGSTTQVLFNDAGAFAGDAGLTYNKTTDALTIAGVVDLSGAVAGQLKFPSTQNASANANTLDDYKEGTYVPADGSAASLTFSTALGTYTKIGRMVWSTVDVVFPSTASGAAVAITLPFTAASTSSSQAGGGIVTFTTVGATHTCYIGSGATSLNFFDTSGGAVNNITYSTKTVRLMLTYMAAN